MLRMAYTCGGGCEELIIASAYVPHDSVEPLPTKERRVTATAGKTNSSLGVIPMHTTYYGGAPAPIPEEKVSWNIW
jgi:hypothetical protein